MAARKQRSQELDAADRNAMPDKVFAFPRLRKEPLNDASHVRNAIARFDQVRDATDAERAEAFRRIKRAAKRFDVEMTEDRWQDLGKPAKSTARSSAKSSAKSSPKSSAKSSPKSSAKSSANSSPRSRGTTKSRPSRAGAGGGTDRADRTRDELYAEAKRRDIKGRSAMTKAELAHALQH